MQVAAMRLTANDTLDCVATVMRVQSVDDGYGNKSDARVAVHIGVPCSVQPIIRTPKTNDVQGVKQEYANFMIVVGWSTDIIASDQLSIVDDKGAQSLFEIDSPYDNKQDGATSQYYCFKLS